MKWIFAFFFFFCNTSFSVLADENNAQMAVEKCASAYIKSAGRFDNYIDRVYVEESKRTYIVGFAHGEVGFFGERDENYGLYFVCYFKDSKVLSVVDSASGRLLFGKKREDGYGDFYKGKVYFYSFLRKGDNFEFYGSGLFAVDGKPAKSLSDDK
ncbi:hypothetical protein [Gallaecimonas pentaromativorans]|uniref:hypothetical protein n=1 Tax=Gallaecimonas pentaromativorans TaxID=584787 RepID=UPI003A8EC7EF